MILDFKGGKIVASAHEVQVRVVGDSHMVLRANTEAITLIGQGANVLVANDNDVQWSVKLDTVQQLETLSQHLGVRVS